MRWELDCICVASLTCYYQTDANSQPWGTWPWHAYHGQNVEHSMQHHSLVQSVVWEWDEQCPEFKFRFVFFRLQMFRFTALCGQIWQKFWGSSQVRSSKKFTKFLLIWFTESWETQHLKAKKDKPKFEFRTLVMSVKRRFCIKLPSMNACIVDSIFLLIVFSSLATISGELSEETKKTINKWAPKLWVHHEEFFKPSNVEYFLHNTRVQDQNNAVLQENPTAGTILNGESTANLNLNTHGSFEQFLG